MVQTVVGRVFAYSDSGYRGSVRDFVLGRYASLPGWNDVVSSLQVPPGWEVILCTDEGFGGEHWVFYSDQPFVGDYMNDKTSSIVVNDRPTSPVFYTDANFSGSQWRARGTQPRVGGRYGNMAHWREKSRADEAPFEAGQSSGLLQFDRDWDRMLYSDGRPLNDSISSVRVPPGWRVVLYEHDARNGWQLQLTSDTPFIGDRYNDGASSMEIFPPGVSG